MRSHKLRPFAIIYNEAGAAPFSAPGEYEKANQNFDRNSFGYLAAVLKPERPLFCRN